MPDKFPPDHAEPQVQMVQQQHRIISSPCSILTISCVVQANTAWAFARLGCMHKPLIASILWQSSSMQQVWSLAASYLPAVMTP